MDLFVSLENIGILKIGDVLDHWALRRSKIEPTHPVVVLFPM